MRFAIYDMDRTITRHGTYTPFLFFWALRMAPWRLLLLPVGGLAAVAYRLGFINRGRLKEIMQACLMGRQPKERITPLLEAFADRIMAQGVYPEALEQIRQDQADGWRVLLATASYRFYVEPLARRFGIADVIATNSHWTPDGLLLPKIDGKNCYGGAKLEMVRAFIADHAHDRIRFYSDHHSDLPVFDIADEPIVTNPNARLAAIARERGWPVIDWRQHHIQVDMR